MTQQDKIKMKIMTHPTLPKIPNFSEHETRIDGFLSSYQIMKGKNKKIPTRFKKAYFKARRDEGAEAFRLIIHYKKFKNNKEKKLI